MPGERLEQFRRLVASIKGVEVKGASMPYTSLNGHMFSFLDKDGNLSLRLPEPLREEFLEKFRTRLSEQHGSVLKEYVFVPPALFDSMPELTRYFGESWRYVSSLKPKAAKK